MKDLLVKYKWIILPGIPLLFFVLTIIVVFTPRTTTSIPTPPQPSQPSQPSVSPFINIDNVDPENLIGEESEESLEGKPGLLKKELLPNGTSRYTFVSDVADRPQVFISQGEYTILFQRYVFSPKFPVKISNYTNVYGLVKWIFKGSNFYGPDAQTYIYPELGIAFIANPKTGEVKEQHLFTPTTVEEYVSKYGDDIPAQP